MTGPIVILLGPMGAGKTAVGRELAARLQVGFADLDDLIVTGDGRSIPEIFAADAESGFRRIESETLARALAEHHGVLSLGGGAVMHPASREMLRERRVVLLEIDEHVAAHRIGRGHGRPMLAAREDPMVRWRQLAAERGPVYREVARWRVDAGRGTPAAVARAITDTLQQDLLPRTEEETR